MNKNREQIESFINSHVTSGTNPLDGTLAVETVFPTTSSQQLQSIMFQHTGKLKAPTDFSLLGKNGNSGYYAFKTFYLGDTNQKVSPLRFMSAQEAGQVPKIPKSDPLYKTKQSTLTRNYKRTKDWAVAHSTHCQLKHPEEWKKFCADPRVASLNTVYTKGWTSLKRKLEDDMYTNLPDKKRKKINWNKFAATTLYKKMGGYINEMKGMELEGGKIAVVRPARKGSKFVWNVSMPVKSLVMRQVQVTIENNSHSSSSSPSSPAPVLPAAGPINL